jgi:hypothetical protein
VGIDTSAQQSALTAQAAATAAAGSAAEVTEIVEGAGEAVDAANTAAGEASASATLAERWANETPGTVVADEKFSALHYATMTERMLATAPNLQFRVFGTHPGEAGTDSVEQTFNNAASDFGRGIAINRLANRPSKLKPLAGLFNGPPQEGADLAMVPTVLTNIGLSDCTIEGPATGSVSLEPAVLISGNETLYNVNTAEPAATPRITLDIPAGTNRRFVAVQGIIYHALPATGAPALTCSAAGATVTQRDTAGDGLNSGTTPIKATIWTGTLPDGGSIPAVNFDFAVPQFWCSRWHYVLIVQNASGVEDYDVGLRAGTGTVSTFAGLSPSIAESMAVVVAMQQGDDANPITIAPGTNVLQGKTPSSRNLKDFSYAVAIESDRPAAPLSYTATSAYGSPGVIGGCVFTPVTGTVTGAALIWRGTLPAVLSPGNMAILWALSDGTRYQLDMVET